VGKTIRRFWVTAWPKQREIVLGATSAIRATSGHPASFGPVWRPGFLPPYSTTNPRGYLDEAMELNEFRLKLGLPSTPMINQNAHSLV